MLRLQRDAVGPLPAVAVRARPVRYVYDTFVGETKVRYTRLTGERAVSGLARRHPSLTRVERTLAGETKVRYTRLTGERAVSGLCCPSGGGPTAPEWGAPE
jgi:hypothetical protein